MVRCVGLVAVVGGDEGPQRLYGLAFLALFPALAFGYLGFSYLSAGNPDRAKYSSSLIARLGCKASPP